MAASVEVEDVVREVGTKEGVGGVMRGLGHAALEALQKGEVRCAPVHAALLREVLTHGPVPELLERVAAELKASETREAHDPERLGRGSDEQKVVYYTFLACVADKPEKAGRRPPHEGYAIGALQALQRIRLRAAGTSQEQANVRAEMAGGIRAGSLALAAASFEDAERKAQAEAAAEHARRKTAAAAAPGEAAHGKGKKAEKAEAAAEPAADAEAAAPAPPAPAAPAEPHDAHRKRGGK